MIGIWVTVVIVGIIGVGALIACIFICENKAAKIGGSFASLIVAGAIIFGLLFWLYHSEAGARAIKNYEANYQGGIERQVTVYDINGNIIEEYVGKFDVDYNDSRIIFDDENGKRHIIYYTTGTVIINELEEGE